MVRHACRSLFRGGGGGIKGRGSLALTPKKPEGGHGNQEAPDCFSTQLTLRRLRVPRLRTGVVLRRREPRPCLRRAGATGKAGVCAGPWWRRCCAAEVRGAPGELVSRAVSGRRAFWKDDARAVARRTLGPRVGPRCQVRQHVLGGSRRTETEVWRQRGGEGQPPLLLSLHVGEQEGRETFNNLPLPQRGRDYLEITVLPRNCVLQSEENE